MKISSIPALIFIKPSLILILFSMSNQFPSETNLTIFAKTNFRNQPTPFGIKQADRRAHVYMIGKTGTGKSTLLETFMQRDVEAGNGFALLDPHGDLITKVLESVPENRKQDVVYFDVTDNNQPYGFNPLDSVPKSKRSLAASGLLSVFKAIWADSWGPRLEHILRNALLALLDQPKATLADILKLMDDNLFRKTVIGNITNEQVRDFWSKEYEGYPARFRAEAIAPIQNKVGAFLTDPILYRILTSPQKPLRLRQVIDSNKILLVNLSKGKIGEDTSSLLGALLVSRIWLAALSRANVPEDSRRDFYLYLDEFHSFTNNTLAQMLSELRKYRLNLILAHQYLSQIDPLVKDAILGNVGTIILFRIGPTDAEVLGQEFVPEFRESDLVNLPNHSIYLKLMIDGKISRPFSAETIKPP